MEEAMKKMTVLALILSIVSAISMVFTFLALTDIAQDYVSPSVSAAQLSDTTRSTLPEWTAARGEWAVVQVDYVIRLISLTLSTLLLISLIAYFRKKTV